MKLTDLLRKPQSGHAISDVPPTDRHIQDFFVRAHYRPRVTPLYFEDFDPDAKKKIYQPDVYSMAEVFATLGVRRLFDIGCGKGEKLRPLADRFDIVGVDIGANIEHCRRTFPVGEWIEHDLESDIELPFARNDLQDSLIICADVIEHLVNPSALLRNL